MAKIHTNGNTMGLPMNVTRGNPIPLDATEVYYSLADAESYAQNNATAYIGQTLKVITNVDFDETDPNYLKEDAPKKVKSATVETYVIAPNDENKTVLVKLADAATVDAAIAAIPEVESIPVSEIDALFAT